MISGNGRKSFSFDNFRRKEAEFKPRLKYGWFHFRLYSNFQDLSQRSIETGFLGDLRRGLSPLNSDKGFIKII